MVLTALVLAWLGYAVAVDGWLMLHGQTGPGVKGGVGIAQILLPSGAPTVIKALHGTLVPAGAPVSTNPGTGTTGPTRTVPGVNGGTGETLPGGRQPTNPGFQGSVPGLG
jgi:hypothetical protein